MIRWKSGQELIGICCLKGEWPQSWATQHADWGPSVYWHKNFCDRKREWIKKPDLPSLSLKWAKVCLCSHAQQNMELVLTRCVWLKQFVLPVLCLFVFNGFGLVSKTNCAVYSIDLRKILKPDQISANVTGVSSSFTQSMLKMVCLVPHSGAGATMSGMPLASFLNHCKVENVLYLFFLVLQLFHYCAFSLNCVTSTSALTTVKKVLSNVSTQRASRSTGGWFLLNWEEF